MLTLPVLGFFALSALAVLEAAAEQTASNSESLPSSVDLRPDFEARGLSRRRQGGRPTCSVFTVTGALEYAVARKRGTGTRLSVEFLNWAGHKATNRAVDGGFFSELWEGYEKFGICKEQTLPYQDRFDVDLQPSDAVLSDGMSLADLGLSLRWIKEWNPETGLTGEEFQAIKVALSQGHPVCGGFRWPKQAEWIEETLQMRAPDEVFDGHSVILVGYRDDSGQPGGGAFIIRNSGGDGSDGFIPYEYARHYLNDAAWIDGAAGGGAS
jgi:hypothetical protein